MPHGIVDMPISQQCDSISSSMKDKVVVYVFDINPNQADSKEPFFTPEHTKGEHIRCSMECSQLM